MRVEEKKNCAEIEQEKEINGSDKVEGSRR